MININSRKQASLFDFSEDVPFATPLNPEFSFIDLFAGIGGFRLAMQSLNGRCVFSSEWDSKAALTYSANFGERPWGDISDTRVKSLIPETFDMLCAGFPCQAFSIAGRRNGFMDTRGTMFFEVADIISKHNPKAVFLENVKGLRSHDKGRTLKTILEILRTDLGYFVPDPKVLNACHFGLPQNRERLLIVAFSSQDVASKFQFPVGSDRDSRINEILEKKEVSVKYYLSKQYLKTLRAHKERHKRKGNGFGYQILSNSGIANAIVVGGMGRERNLVYDHRLSSFTPVTNIKGEVNREGIRKMTPREWARLQGFPDDYVIPVSDAAAYKQFGNSVPVPVIKAVGRQILDALS